MGVISVLRYPTMLVGGAADHSYVECGSGAVGWGCWGGKSGGTTLRQRAGSTERAAAIAEPNERAGITTYLLNGVCHQSSNRILLPARTTADGVRGYTLSVGLFGPYGRLSSALGKCKAPLHIHEGLTGDIDQCMAQVFDGVPLGGEPLPYDFQDDRYMSAVGALYRAGVDVDPSILDGFTMQIDLFRELVAHRMRRVRRRIERRKYGRVMHFREQFEVARVGAEQSLFFEGNRLGFCQVFDQLTLSFQDDLAAILDDEEYEDLLGLQRQERIVISEPRIVQSEYGSTQGGAAS
ncbi:MAG: hypothetical protein DI562_02005 [Stenotrophomonas acidaminiphila]|nr:MAG: hypothetical protein DI562_02005 [Stenotrophomonas acidaminiphila]